MARPAATLQQSVRLVPFETGLPSGLGIQASLSWSSAGWLDLCFTVLAEDGLAELVLPQGLLDGEQCHGMRRDGLWQTTCFEAFLGLPGERRYWEINLAANGDWAVYRFSDYRTGQAEQSLSMPPTIHLQRRHHQLRLEARLDLNPWWPANLCPDMALTAVLDRGDTGLSHWAIRHPSDHADFHQRQGFLAN